MPIPGIDQQNALQSALGITDLVTLQQKIRLVQAVQAVPQHLRKKSTGVTGANPYALATLGGLQLPDYLKAASILRATVRAGGVTGELAVQAFGTTPITGQIAVAPSGDIVVLGSDAITDMDIVYVPEALEVFEFQGVPSSNAITIDTAYGPGGLTAKGVVLLMEAEILTGTAPGKKIPLVPGAGAPAAGQARLNLAKTTVTFNGTDAATLVRVKIGVARDLA